MPRTGQSPFQLLSEEVVHLARLLNRPGYDRFRATRKEILQAIADHEGLTVPHLARIIGTSRQNIQFIIDRLKSEGCVDTSDNPAHKRSPLFSLTPHGSEVLVLASRAESRMSERLDLSEAQILAALQVLSHISQQLGSNRTSRTSRTSRARRLPTAAVRRSKASPLPIPPGREHEPFVPEMEANELPVNLL
jgi:DNA-binding MarR family transcriptional regulator